MTDAPFLAKARQRNRYILNKRHKVAHDRTRLTERCNTDDIVDRRSSDYVPEGYRACIWCRLVAVS